MHTFRWIGHESDIMKKVAEFYRNEIFTDCTFLVEGQYLRGHKTILCACSPYFQELFKSEFGNKIISLKNVRFSDLKSMFMYIYFGVVDIPLCQVISFLNTSNLLGIKGLDKLCNTENVGRLEETAGALSSSAYCDGISHPIESKVQQEERNEMPAPIFVKVEPFVIAEDREEYGDLNEDPNVLSECDLKSEYEMDIVETSVPAVNLPERMENFDVSSIQMKDERLEEDNSGNMRLGKCFSADGEKQSLDFNDDAVFHHEVELKTEGLDPEEPTALVISNPEQQLDEHPRAGTSEEDLKRSSRNLPFACEHCSATFSKEKNLVVHQRKHADPRPSSSASYTSERQLSVHQGKHTGKRPYVCEECTASYTLKASLVRHERTHTGERPYICNDCSASFTSKANLDVHQRKHTGERPYVCEVCSASFPAKTSLVKHERTHTGERPYICNNCSASFTSKGSLDVHQRKHTGERPYICEVCSASYAIKASLVAHQLTHTGERPFICKTCSASYTRKGQLNVHQRKHTGERPYVCEVCSASFPVKTSLVKHERTHTGERPYICNFCSATFASKGSLDVHQRKHTGERPYSCRECNATFITSGHLVEHLRIHTGERPYTCTECVASFTRQNDLKIHQRKHTGERPYTCNKCPATFVRRDVLVRHLLVHKYQLHDVCS